MAGRGGPKVKEFRVPVTSLKQWQNEIAFPGLSVVEIYSSSFGSCQVILPLINTIMMNTENSDSSIKWLTVNVGKIEEEARTSLEEEAKKAAEIQSQLNIKRMSLASQSNSPVSPINEESKENDQLIDQPNNEEKTNDEIDPSLSQSTNQSNDSKHAHKRKSTPVITLPGLEAYAGYDHPRPLWLFFVDGQMRYELTSCNPPKLNKLVAACLTNTQLSEAELSNMELASDSKEVSEEKKRKRKLAKMLQEQEAAKLKQQQDAEARKKKREITRDPEYLINLSIEQFDHSVRNEILKIDESNGTDPRVCIVLSFRETEADDYVYHSQTAALPVDQSKSLVFPASIVMKKLENAEVQANTELKLAIYDTADDEPIRGERANNGCLGEIYVKAGPVLSGDIKQVHFVYTDHSVPPLSPTAAKSPRGVPKVEQKVATLSINAYERPSEGICTDYRFNFTVDVDGLPEPAPVKEPVEGEEPQPAGEEPQPEVQVPPTSWTFSMSILDAAAPVPVNQATQNIPTKPTTFSIPVVTHYSRMERTFVFVVKDGEILVGQANMTFSSVVSTRSNNQSVDIPLLNSSNEGVTNVKAVIQIDELDAEGNVVAAEGEVEGEQTNENASNNAANAVDADEVRVTLAVDEQGAVQVKIRLGSQTEEQSNDQPSEIPPVDTLSVAVKEAKSAEASPRQELSPQHLSPKGTSPKITKGSKTATSKPGSKQPTPRVGSSKPVSKASTPRVEYTHSSKANSKATTPRVDPTSSKPGSKAVTPRESSLSVSKGATPRETSNSLSAPGQKNASPRVDKPSSNSASPRTSVTEQSSSKAATPRAEPSEQAPVAATEAENFPITSEQQPVAAAEAENLPITPATEPAAAEETVAVVHSKSASVAASPREPVQSTSSKPASKPASKAPSQSNTPRVEPTDAKPSSKPTSQAATPRVDEQADKPSSKPASKTATPRVDEPADNQSTSSKPASQAATPRVDEPADKPSSKPASKPATPRVDEVAEKPASKPSSRPASKPASQSGTPRVEQTENAAPSNAESTSSKPASKPATPRVESTDAPAQAETKSAEEENYEDDAQPTESAEPAQAGEAYEDEFASAPEATAEQPAVSSSKPASKQATPRVEAVSKPQSKAVTPRVEQTEDKEPSVQPAASSSKPASKQATPRVEAASIPQSKAATPRVEQTEDKQPSKAASVAGTPRVEQSNAEPSAADGVQDTTDACDDGSVVPSVEAQ